MSTRKPEDMNWRKKPSSEALAAAFAFCVLMHVADGWTRLDLVEHGLPASLVEELAALIGMSLNGLARALGIPATTIRTR